MSTSLHLRERLTSLRAAHAAVETGFCGAPPSDSTGSAASVACETVDAPLETVVPPRFLEIVELILKDRPRLERIIGDPWLSAELIPRFLAVALMGFTLFGIALAIIVESIGIRMELSSVRTILQSSGSALIVFHPAPPGLDLSGFAGRALRLIAAYDLGLIAAAGVCLPSLYFYALLAGVPMSMARVAVHTLKGMATTAVALVGILPIYMALSLAVAVFHLPGMLAESVLWLGLLLPFGAGLFGMLSLYAGFTALADAIPTPRRCQRACLLRRLVVSWSVCYAAVTPVMIYTLWEYFARPWQ
jgi:hypothetical protein